MSKPRSNSRYREAAGSERGSENEGRRGQEDNNGPNRAQGETVNALNKIISL
jgi:hypothetical protein